MSIEKEIIESYKKSLSETISAKLSFFGLLGASSIWLASVPDANDLVKILSIDSTLLILVASFYLLKIPESFLKIYKYLLDLYKRKDISDEAKIEGVRIGNENHELNKSYKKIINLFSTLSLFFLMAATVVFSLSLVEINIV